MASILLVPPSYFLLVILLLIPNMAITVVAFSRTQNMMIIHYHQGHYNHEKARTFVSISLAMLSKGIQVPDSDHSHRHKDLRHRFPRGKPSSTVYSVSNKKLGGI
ncbi:hypothetical protein TanjilG_02997 [Lupinus angustifolius]|uniref:Uncharacterized protein n=1 Tax=Lupinus angustifolius TaxID=3871 RepID=A0A4P1RCX3_LUPAN|nr:hypothetical protein TanjilG_02997 [Lupinus angustifolius]